MTNTNILLTIIFLCININFSFCQDAKNEYRKFMSNGIEFQTNGIDTILIVDPMPEFPGGEAMLSAYLVNNLVYPKKARKNKIEGKVVVRFVVDKTGDIKDITIIKSVNKDLDNEAIRVVKEMPKWKPGEQNGNPIPVQYSLPISFTL